MAKSIFAIILLFLSVTWCSAQSVTRIKGIVTDQSTKEPVGYAGINIEGTFTGTASDPAGNFEFDVPHSNTGTYLIVSAVGYQTVRIAISEIYKELFKVELIPASYEIGNVDVIAESAELKRILKEAIENIGTNYCRLPFSRKIFYKNDLIVNKQAIVSDEALLDFSDSRGYYRESVLEAFNHRNYAITGVRRNHEVKHLSDGMNHLDEMVNLDIARTKGNILDINYLSNYDLKLDRTGKFEGDSVWVINYRLRKPNFSQTGDFYVKSYQGKIYISKTNYTILKNETVVKASNYSRQGRGFINAEEKSLIPVSIGYEFSTIYRKDKSGYNLAYLKCNRNNTWKDKTSGETKNELITSVLIPMDLNTNNPTFIKGRTYFSDMAFDKAVWDGFDLKVE